MTLPHPDANPLLEPWTAPFEAPPFDRIAPRHFEPAFEAALKEARAEIDAIAADPAPPTFANTIEAMERSGRTLDRVAKLFFNLAGAETNDELEAIERAIAPVLSRHASDTYLNDALFRRIDALKANEGRSGSRPSRRARSPALISTSPAPAPGSRRKPRPGSPRSANGSPRCRPPSARTCWRTNGPGTMARRGRPRRASGLLGSRARRGSRPSAAIPARYAVTLARSSVEPFLQFSARRDLREAAFRAWGSRGENGGATDNRAIAGEMVRLRAERAKLLGYESHAHYRLADAMAKTPSAALDLLELVWTPAAAAGRREAEALQAIVAHEGGNFRVAPWDWRYLAEKRRKAEYDFDESATKPYLQLDRMIDAAFYAAGRLFGVSFAERFDVPLHHPDARAWTVTGRDGAPIALFIGDYFARPSKRSGAWMSNFRGQQKLDRAQAPIVINVMNFAKGGDGEPSLLSFDDARTLFHEFGHALHGLLSDVTYPILSGTRVAGDFVEFPSQLYEHWLEQPEMLRRFAVHYKTGEPMPEALIDKLARARRFNQGFATVEYTASALVDLKLHLDPAPDTLDVVAFERGRTRADRHAGGHRDAPPHAAFPARLFRRLFGRLLQLPVVRDSRRRRVRGLCGGGRHLRSGGRRRLRDFVYAAGGTRDYDEAYRAFRGRAPSPAALFRKRGLDPGPAR